MSFLGYCELLSPRLRSTPMSNTLQVNASFLRLTSPVPFTRNLHRLYFCSKEMQWLQVGNPDIAIYLAPSYLSSWQCTDAINSQEQRLHPHGLPCTIKRKKAVSTSQHDFGLERKHPLSSSFDLPHNYNCWVFWSVC